MQQPNSYKEYQEILKITQEARQRRPQAEPSSETNIAAVSAVPAQRSLFWGSFALTLALLAGFLGMVLVQNSFVQVGLYQQSGTAPVSTSERLVSAQTAQIIRWAEPFVLPVTVRPLLKGALAYRLWSEQTAHQYQDSKTAQSK